MLNIIDEKVIYFVVEFVITHFFKQELNFRSRRVTFEEENLLLNFRRKFLDICKLLFFFPEE